MMGVHQGGKRATFLNEFYGRYQELGAAARPSPADREGPVVESRAEGYSNWMKPGARMPSGSYFFLAASIRGHWSP